MILSEFPETVLASKEVSCIKNLYNVVKASSVKKLLFFVMYATMCKHVVLEIYN